MQLNSTKVVANLDDLEGGFDGLMQILLCKTEMKWRDNSRKIVIIATDGYMHTAGDGILAGAVKKSIGECDLDENGFYRSSLDYDYPSLEEIARKLKEKKVNNISRYYLFSLVS